MDFKGTLNWRIRELPQSDDTDQPDFFIEADIPNADEKGFYPRTDLLAEDYGEHNGYTREMRMADAELIVAAPALLANLRNLVKEISAAYERIEELNEIDPLNVALSDSIDTLSNL